MNERLPQHIAELSAEQQKLLRLRLAQRRQQTERPACFHELFEAQVRRFPDRVALVAGEVQLSYAALDEQANRLAHLLRAHGVGPETLVGLCLPRSPEMVVGLLAVMKAGGAYVPLDSGYPRERLAYMAADAGLAVLLTRRSLADLLPGGDATVLDVETVWPRLAEQPATPPASGVTAENLAYVIYTSGSTGRPKGVQVPHRGIRSLVAWQRENYGLDTPQRVLQSTSLSFDISVWELSTALLSGSSLVLAPPELKMIGTDLADFLTEQAIENIGLTPSALATLPAAELPALRPIGVGGEACPLDLVQLWAADRGFFNGYGPTETTVAVSLARFGPDLERVHIGRPIPGAQLYILDSRLQPVPVGVAGELYVGGNGVARGYLGRPELTAEVFVADPFGRQPGGRLYKTGDRVRHLADGTIEFLGRIDAQVKIRGHRVELGEIESALTGHPRVRAAAVLVHGEADGKRLVAYVVADDPLPVEDLQAHLADRLPAHMVPSIFVALDGLPLDPNGKLDRRALAAVDWQAHADTAQGEYVAPRTRVEEQLAEIWRAVLGVAHPVGVHDNFFALGGDSILSLQVIFRAKQLGLQLTVKQLFEHQTVAELGAVVVRQDAPVVHAEQGPVTGPVELTPVQRWFFTQRFAQPHWFNQALLLTVPTDPAPEQWPGLLRRLVEHHDGLRARYAPDGDGWRAELAAPGAEPVWQVHDLSSVPAGQRADRLAELAQQAQRGFDLAEAPLFRAALFTGLDDGQHRLLLVAHHLVVDVVSWRILLDDLATLAAQLRDGRDLVLPPKSTSWQQWARRLGQEAAGPASAAELPYWLEQTEVTRPLPLDGPADDNTAARARVHEVSLSREETQALLQEVPAAFNTRANDVLLTAVAAALGAWTGDSHVRVDVEGHGREDLFDDVDLSRTVGWFTTISPVRLPVPAPDALAAGLKEIKELLRRRPRHGIGYGLLRDGGTEAGARLRDAPAAQLSFNHLGEFDGTFAGDLAAAPESAGTDVGPDNQRLYLIDVVSRVQDGRLRMQWSHHGTVHRPETVDRVARHTLDVLRQLTAAARDADQSSYSPSDLPASGLDQAEIDGLVGQLRELPVWRDSGKLRPLEDVYPQTPLQQGLWFQSQYAQGQGLYHVQVVLRIERELQADLFRQAWAEVMRRHPILRTSFWAVPDHEPLQLVWRQIPVPLEERDWRAEPADQQQEHLDAYLRRERVQGFEPHEIPQWRMLLARTGDDDYRFVLSAHHTILDGWSNSLLLAEVVQSYEALVHGRTDAVAPTRPYRDYVAWLGEQDMQQAEAYWRETLHGIDQAAPLSVERKREAPAQGAPEPDRSASVGVFLDEDETVELQELAQSHHLTLNTVLQGCWALLMSRYSRSDDVIFGSVVSGRPPEFEGAERMIGLFINTLPIRVRVAGDKRWLDWLKEIQDQNTRLRQYEYSPLIQVQQWSGIPADGQLFESLFVFENYPLESDDESALRFTVVDAEERTNFPLNVVVNPGERLGISILYDTGRFDRRTIDGMLAHLLQACRSLISSPQARVAELSLLDEVERGRILHRWNVASLSHDAPGYLHELFAAQAARTPDAVALVHAEEQLSYGELDARANQVAQHLRSAGVGPDVLVGLCLDRSVEVLVGLLGILKAGGAYVPLDPGYPADRLAFLVEDAGLRLVLTQAHLAGKFADIAPTLRLDADWSSVFAGEPTEAPATPDLTPENLAYIIYTSGSTGRPKGVMVAHRCVNHVVPWQQEHDCLARPQRVLQVASYSFDFSVWEILMPLLTGGTLHIPRPGVHMIGQDLHDVLVERAIENLSFTPGALATLPPQGVPHLRTLVVGGEAYPADLIRTWAPGRTFFNVYGPTETTIFATGTPVDEHLDVLHMGRPITNVETYVLDEHLQPVPVGVPGELYIGGVGVTRGYLNRPELTAESFVANPYGEPGSRLYRSGDLVRWLPDGNIEFVGRVDHQVKIRGFRIELGEIEAALVRHPRVRTCAVLVLPDGSGQRLVAYVEPEPEPESRPEVEATELVAELRGHLGETLPRHMVPSAFVCLDQLPLNRNGKLNRRALPLPEEAAAAPLAEGALPRTRTEALLATIFEQVLGRAPIGIFDDFFTLGGHSLLAVQVVARIRHTFGVEVPVRVIFEKPTIAQVAVELEGVQQGQHTHPVAPLVPVPRDRALPATFDQQRLWFMDRLNPNSAFYTVGWLLHWPAELDRSALDRALHGLITRHETLRTTFHHRDNRVWQVVADEPEVALAETDLSTTAPEQRQEAAKRLVFDWWGQPLDLGAGPLLRTLLIRFSATEAVLAFSAHHTVVDGYSIRLFNRELRQLYQADVAGEPSPLPELAVQYADYAVWQQQWLEEERLRPHLDYWKEQLADAPGLITLPLDKPRPAVQTFRGSTHTGTLSPEVTRQVRQVSVDNRTTQFITVLSAFAALLAHYSGQQQVVIGVPIANRNRIETEPLIGFLVNTVALCVDFTGNPEFGEVLRQVRWKLLEAQSHQEIPFERIVEELKPERSSSHSPIFQVMFTGLDKIFEKLPEEQEPGWIQDVTNDGMGVAKFDVGLSLQEKDGALQYTFEYSTDLFEAPTIARMAGHFETLIAGALTAPATPVAELPLLSTAERDRRIEEWNATGDERLLEPGTLHELFEKQARQHPDRIVLSYEDQQVSYAELDRRTNQLARALRAAGVGPESRVGICAERSLELVVGLVAILKAGGAYVPLDPEHPADRMGFMVADAQIQAILVQPTTRDRVEATGSGVPLLDLAGPGATWSGESTEPLTSGVRADNLAYVIYTSGSTGKPKGAMLSHRGIRNRLLWMQDEYGLRDGDRVLQKTPFSFDVSVWEFFWPLIVGAQLHVARPEGHRDPGYLAETIERQGIGVLHFVPSMLQAFLEQPGVTDHCHGIRHVMCSGEALPLDLQERFLRQLPGVRLHNLYGPTEASVDVSFWECRHVEGATTVPIGRPVANTQLYVLNPAMAPVPDGVVGELFIGGVQLARGYLGRPELTAQHFVANPFGPGRLYATGDLARQRPDGVIEYAGRKDHQIKIRGHRIEVGEIEAVLAQHPAVQSCLLTVHEVAAADKRLAAFYTLDEGRSVTVDELRDHLGRQLPEYMIPTYFVPLPEFPLSPNGKVDRKALPALDAIVRQAQERFVAPRTGTERQLAEIWTRLLNVERIGLHDDFFALGGHSLLVASLATEVQNTWDVSLMLPMVFQNRTLAALAQVIDDSLADEEGEEADADELFLL
ncbi:non-ribosomal peptide synthetase [Micromonospora siamensis]|uniref:Non-ribosomal peptide synthase domain TIGR01720/amino acid adenylation domain-containing protein n=1 Tax=Micromonospora siamensis TaxID=299152 RepID=A0A1C5H7F7_9ACTN|nr:non-ribosomal peptide synthetase [Micromonospora siamensis]SCG41958.1 non-ribosomal peptide synthase domain TIGR01720/amino acid adenylation domain-containing protein [Micromonospora siamensis]